MSAAAIDDSPDLEALFDSIASAQQEPPVAPAKAAAAARIAAKPERRAKSTAKPRPVVAANGDATDTLVQQIGQMTRELHDALRELGYDQVLKTAAQAIPDTRERLQYVVSMTQQAAERALNAVDVARPLQEKIESDSVALAQEWDAVFAGTANADAFKQLATRTREFLGALPAQTQATNAQLLDIMMAQDFQDLTGQVIQRISEVTQKLEHQMVKLLLDNTPPERLPEHSDSLLNGPVIQADGRSDVVSTQDQVDDLLETLGF